MFLDEKLLQVCIDYSGTTSEDIQELNKRLCRLCEYYYKSKITEMSTEREVKVALDRTFNMWDSFVRMALKSNDKVLIIMGELFEKYTFKMQFLKDEKLASVYNSLN